MSNTIMKEKNRAQQDRSYTYEHIYMWLLRYLPPQPPRHHYGDICRHLTAARKVKTKLIYIETKLNQTQPQSSTSAFRPQRRPCGSNVMCPWVYTSVDVCVNVTKSNSWMPWRCFSPHVRFLLHPRCRDLVGEFTQVTMEIWAEGGRRGVRANERMSWTILEGLLTEATKTPGRTVSVISQASSRILTVCDTCHSHSHTLQTSVSCTGQEVALGETKESKDALFLMFSVHVKAERHHDCLCVRCALWERELFFPVLHYYPPESQPNNTCVCAARWRPCGFYDAHALTRGESWPNSLWSYVYKLVE